MKSDQGRLRIEADRLAALITFAIQGSELEQVFDEVAQLAARACDAPFAFISFVDENRQWFKGAVGLSVRETPLSHSICAYAIRQDGLFVVPDTKKDRSFYRNPAEIGEPHVRFYAGAVLRTDDGLPLGTLCVLDTHPRATGLTSVQSEILSTLARSVVRELELRCSAAHSRQQFLLLEAALENMRHGLSFFDRERRLLMCNSRYAEMYRLPSDLVRPGTRLEDIVDHRYENGTGPEITRAEYLSRSHIAGAGGQIDVPLRMRDGRTIAIGHQPMADGGWVATHVDITERKEAERKSWWLANHDPMTGLANRVLFLDRFNRALRHAETNGSNVTVLLLDLDNFKDVNDALGHDAGDALLNEVSARLSAALRDCDTVARIGGDEFGMLIIEPLSFENCIRLADHIVQELRQPFHYKSRSLSCRASVGIASFPDHDSSIPDLMKDADVALYRAKADGRNRAVAYWPEMRQRAEAKVRLLEAVRRALIDEQFVPFYQPKLSITTAEVVGFEALARWLHPIRGVLTPGAFGSAINDPEIADAIGVQMVRKVAADLSGWLAAGIDCGPVAINVSSAEFRNPGLADSIMTVWEAAGLSFTHLEIEVTETVFLGSESGNVKSILRRFHERGVRLALDDFGTGYASLAHLKEFDIDHIKIDRSFVRGLLENSHDRAIVCAILALGRSFGMLVTAEGIETEEQAAQLRGLGCEFGQGFLYARPMAASQVPAFLQHQKIRAMEDRPALSAGSSARRTELEATGRAAAVIDALDSQICVVDHEGVIIAVNRAWRQFGVENGGHPSSSDVGTHYLRTCYGSSGPGSDEASGFAQGVRAVLEGTSENFELEYPCHSPTAFRWFLGRVTPLGSENGGAVIAHLNITERKAMESALVRLAGTDSLTGLPNRRSFFDLASHEVERVRRFTTPASIMMIDLDHFKGVNDIHGHAAGDKTLQIVARACLERLREVDVLARLGGEEFAAILPGTGMEDAAKVAEKLRRAVGNAVIDLGSEVTHVTASFGLSEVWPDDISIESALERADEALYAAKAAGRNCVRSFAAVHFKAAKRRAGLRGSGGVNTAA